MPSFDGKEENWWKFRDHFEWRIHQRKDMCKSEKLTWLQQCVDADAVRLMDYAFDYDETWSDLTRRYDKPDRHIDMWINRLSRMPACPLETRGNLMKVIDVVLTLMRVLRRHGHDPENGSVWVCALILTKLPPATVVHLKLKQLELPKRSLTTMVKDLERICEAMWVDSETVSEPRDRVRALKETRQSSPTEPRKSSAEGGQPIRYLSARRSCGTRGLAKSSSTGGAVIPAADGKRVSENMSARRPCGTRGLAKSSSIGGTVILAANGTIEKKMSARSSCENRGLAKSSLTREKIASVGGGNVETVVPDGQRLSVASAEDGLLLSSLSGVGLSGLLWSLLPRERHCWLASGLQDPCREVRPWPP